MIDMEVKSLESGFSKRRLEWLLITISFFFLSLFFSYLLLTRGDKVYSINEALRGCLGKTGTGTDFVMQNIRLPRLLAGILAGWSFGMAGNAFQTMLRNPLASPDMIGVSTGSAVAAVFCILVLGQSGEFVSFFSVVSGLVVAAFLYFISSRSGFSAGRLILIGIGVQALGRAIISFLLLRAAQYDLLQVMRWMSGSLNSTSMEDVVRMLFLTIPFSLLLLLFSRHLQLLELGRDMATGLGVDPARSQFFIMIFSVALLAFATAVTGPIACVSFLAGPISMQLVKRRSSLSAGLLGVLLVLSADFISQNFLPARYPVGVVTGILGAPYLLYLIFKMNQKGLGN